MVDIKGIFSVNKDMIRQVKSKSLEENAAYLPFGVVLETAYIGGCVSRAVAIFLAPSDWLS